jgi:P27 family predicted phage terminase small subunit
MGERGPLPVPYARRRNRRNGSTHTRGQYVTVARPAIPRSLKGEARAEWNRVVPELEEIGMLAAIDRGVLIRYCTAWADWCECEALLQKSGKLIRGQKGNFVRNPLLMVRSDMEATLSDLGKQLGLSPGARLRAGVIHERPPDARQEEVQMTAIEEYKPRLGVADPRDVLREPS